MAEGKVVPRENPRKQWKHETRKAVRELLARGLNHTQVAMELGVSKPTVSYHARKLGIQPDEKASRRYDWDAIQAAHDGACRCGSAVPSSAARDPPGMRPFAPGS